MRKAAFAGLFACLLVIIGNNQHANALSIEDIVEKSNENSIASNEKLLAIINSNKFEGQLPVEPQQPTSQNVDYTVESGDSLVKIAKKFDTTWQQIFYKNTDLEHPDTIIVGQTILIPSGNEDLEPRDIPAPKVVVVKNTAPTAPVKHHRSTTYSSAGNTYTYGYCTWYVKNRRPDIPNGLGDARTWLIRAQRLGLTTSATPIPGAVGQRNNHVVYVESVNGDGTITISEMNRRGWNVTSTRTVPANTFHYIY